MCGLGGVVTLLEKLDITACLNKAREAQYHRGPDIQSEVVFSANQWKIGLCHQRLSILDLSDAGSQPMTSSGASWLVYNGEVYNYLEIKTKLPQSIYKSNTDTEVILNALEEWGIHASVNEFNGMWAFVWYNPVSHILYLCRDRVGVKPLYYYLNEDSLYFASEVKAILEMTGQRFDLDFQTVGEYLHQSLQNTSDNTFYQQIKAVPAAHYLEIDLKQPRLMIKKTKYWDVLDAKAYTGKNIVQHIQDLFADAVRIRMRSDVPVGVTLSGGVDSSSIAAIMKESLGEQASLHILSAVSPGSESDESPFIDIMAESLKTEIYKVNLFWEPSEAINLLKTAIWHNDAPLGSFSNVAHYLLMQKAHELGVTVILSGQGADELLCGYKKYVMFYLQFLFREKKFFATFYIFLQFLCAQTVFKQFNLKEAKRYFPRKLKNQDSILGSKLKSHYQPKEIGLLKKQTLQERQVSDLTEFSVPFLTHYEDRMSMAWSREVRLPFLDYRLMELLIHLPIHKKIRNGWTKYSFRKAMHNHLPKKIAWRKDKQGFVNPQEDWLRYDLKDTIHHFFYDGALIFKLGLVNREALLHKYNMYCSNSLKKHRVWYREIFNPLALEIWLQLNKKYLTIIDEG